VRVQDPTICDIVWMTTSAAVLAVSSWSQLPGWRLLRRHRRLPKKSVPALSWNSYASRQLATDPSVWLVPPLKWPILCRVGR